MIEIWIYLSGGADASPERDLEVEVIRSVDKLFVIDLSREVQIRTWDYRDEPPELVPAGQFAAKSLRTVDPSHGVVDILGAGIPTCTPGSRTDGRHPEFADYAASYRGGGLPGSTTDKETKPAMKDPQKAFGVLVLGGFDKGNPVVGTTMDPPKFYCPLERERLVRPTEEFAYIGVLTSFDLPNGEHFGSRGWAACSLTCPMAQRNGSMTIPAPNPSPSTQ